MHPHEIQGISRAQRVAREIVLECAQGVEPGQSERSVVARMEERFAAAGVRHWLHTPYAWWGERSRFQGFGVWEADALASDRALKEGEAFILDAAPLVEGYPADFAYSGLAPGGEDPGLHAQLLRDLAALKDRLVEWAREAATGAGLFAQLDREIHSLGHEPVHPLYPGGVLGHRVEGFPNFFGRLPRLGDGFQFGLLGPYAVQILGHQLLGRPYPFINSSAPGRLQGLFAVEPHLGHGPLGAKFESILLIDGDETRWLDPGLFGEVAHA